ncbi:hypothetical protein LY78DRAFT_661095, partial [Colletotrichum sublineola]
MHSICPTSSNCGVVVTVLVWWATRTGGLAWPGLQLATALLPPPPLGWPFPFLSPTHSISISVVHSLLAPIFYFY